MTVVPMVVAMLGDNGGSNGDSDDGNEDGSDGDGGDDGDNDNSSSKLYQNRHSKEPIQSVWMINCNAFGVLHHPMGRGVTILFLTTNFPLLNHIRK